MEGTVISFYTLMQEDKSSTPGKSSTFSVCLLLNSVILQMLILPVPSHVLSI